MLQHHIKLAISSCLSGHPVRYDGTSKANLYIQQRLPDYFHCIPVCPETGIGMGVPRKPIQLVMVNDEIHVKDVQTGKLDYTAELKEFAINLSIQQIQGMVVKARSPSCGLNTTPVYQMGAAAPRGVGNGIYTDTMLKTNKSLVCIDEETLSTRQGKILFFTRLFLKHVLCRLIDTKTGTDTKQEMLSQLKFLFDYYCMHEHHEFLQQMLTDGNQTSKEIEDSLIFDNYNCSIEDDVLDIYPLLLKTSMLDRTERDLLKRFLEKSETETISVDEKLLCLKLDKAWHDKTNLLGPFPFGLLLNSS